MKRDAGIGPRATVGFAIAALAIAVLAIASDGARAAPVARAVDPEPPRRFAHPHAGVGGAFALGMTRADGADDAWLARIEFEGLLALPPPGRTGPLFGLLSAGEVWIGDDDWGLGLPFAMALGVRTPGLRAIGLLGWQTLIVDQVDDDTGVGFFAPMAGAQVVFETRGWHLGVDARAVRRWQFGADDRTQWQAAITLGFTTERRQDEPLR